MSPRPESESVQEYVAVLRGIGLTEPAIADAHDLDWSGAELQASIADYLGDASQPDYWAALVDAVANSPRGIDAPLSYWNHAPEVHLDELLEPYGCSVQIEPTRRANSLAAGTFVIRLTDATGTEFWTRFEYPDSELAEDNYPSLLYHVQTELLAPAGLQIVRLTAPPSRWRFALLTRPQLEALRDRYGERVEVFGAPMLATNQPDAFATEEPPIPPAYETSDGSQSSDQTRFGQARPSIDRSSPASLEEVAAETAGGASDDGAGEIELEFDDGPADPEGIVATVETANAGSASTAAVSGTADVEASDEELESVFGDLSSVSLEPEEPEPEEPASDEGATLSIDGGTVTERSDAGDDDPLDDLFETIKRDVADSDPEPADPDAGRDASISDLVSGVAEDGASGRGDSQGDSDSSGAHDAPDAPDDVPRDAADLTASELFTDLDDRD